MFGNFSEPKSVGVGRHFVHCVQYCHCVLCVGCGAKNDSEVPSGESFFATLNGINPKSIKIMEI